MFLKSLVAPVHVELQIQMQPLPDPGKEKRQRSEQVEHVIWAISSPFHTPSLDSEALPLQTDVFGPSAGYLIALCVL